MSGFFTPFPDTEQPVPSGTDSYGVNTPNWRGIGQQIASGVKDAGGLGQTSGGVSWILAHPIDALLTGLAYAIAFALTKTLCILSFLMRLITSIDDAAAPGIDAVVGASLDHVFGVPFGAASTRRVGASLNTEATAKKLGASITASLAGGVPASAGSTLQPGTAAADKFLGNMARMGIEGWIDGFVAEACGGERLASVLELVPIMAETLGLGRISRQVLMPVLKILVQEPYTWFLNLNYRPTVLPEAAAVREFLRGRIDETQLDGILGKLGHSAANIDALKNINSKMLSIGDIDYLVAHGAWSQDQGKQELRNEGWNSTNAGIMVNLAEQRRIDAHHQRVIEATLAAYVKREIPRQQLDAALTEFTLAEGERDAFGHMADSLQALNIKHLSLAEVETLIKAHIMSLDDLQTWMTREGYPAEEQTLLETYLLGKITTADEAAAAKKAAATARAQAAAARQQKAAATAAAAAARAQVKGVSLATMEHLVESGKRTFAEFAVYLQDLGLTAPAIQDVIDNLHLTIDQKQAAAQQHAALTAEADQKHIPLSQVESNVENGTLTMTDLQNFLTANEYSAADAALIISVVEGKIAAKATTKAAKAGAAAAAGSKGISLPALERAARLGIATVAAYSAALTKAGYDAQSRDFLVGILQDQIAADTATLAKRKAAAARAATGKVSLTQLEQAVIAGVRPITDYTAALAALGFDATDQQTLTELLQVRVEHAQTVAATRKTAAGRLAARGITLAQLERAVKLGVVPVDAYTAALAAAGFDAQDIAILRASLLAELATSKQSATRRNSVAATLAKRGISLAQEEQLVKTGILPLDAYSQFLTAQGYAAGDVANLTALLADKLDQAKAAAALHAAAVQRAQDRDISLGKEETAVLDGVRTMADYQAIVGELGYDAIDQATLVGVLAAKVAAARAKAAAKSGTPAPPATPAVP